MELLQEEFTWNWSFVIVETGEEALLEIYKQIKNRHLSEHTTLDKTKDGWRPVRRRIPFFAPDKQKIKMNRVKDLLARDLIERKETEWRAPLLVVPKPCGGLSLIATCV
jgi:hypothetical protein